MTDALYQRIFDALPYHMVLLDEHGIILDANHAWGAFAEANGGIPNRVGAGADYLAVCDRAQRDDNALAAQVASEVAARLRDLLAGEGDDFSLAYPCHSPRQRRWFLCRAIRVPDSDPARVIVVHEDITTATNAREAERVLGGHSHELFNFAPDATLIVDEQGQIVLANRQVEALFGYPTQDLLGSCVESLLPEGVRERHAALRTGYLTAPQRRQMGTRNGPLEALHRSGERIPVEVSLGPFTTSEGTWTLASIRDIRERTALEARLWQAEKLETIGLLAGGIAHDFNNLLTVIAGTTSLLRDAPIDPATIHEDLATISHACEEAALLTRTLLTFAKQSPVQPQILSLASFWERKVPVLRRLVGEDIDLRVAVLEEDLFVHMDPIQLEQVVLNLIVNSRDAMPRGGVIEVRCMAVELDAQDPRCLQEMTPGPHVLLHFEDNGPGIPKAVQSRIFEPFFTTKEHGTGIGLATVHGIIHQNHGNIWCDCTGNEGAAFMILLPRSDPPN